MSSENNNNNKTDRNTDHSSKAEKLCQGCTNALLICMGISSGSGGGIKLHVVIDIHEFERIHKSCLGALGSSMEIHHAAVVPSTGETTSDSAAVKVCTCHQHQDRLVKHAQQSSLLYVLYVVCNL